MKRCTVGIRHPEEQSRPATDWGSLWMMEGYGLVKLKRDGRGVEPVALATSFKILID